MTAYSPAWPAHISFKSRVTLKNISYNGKVDEKRGLIYRMRLKMTENSISVIDQDIQLQSGMAVTAEVNTDKRQVIEFRLTPLLKHGKESLRER